MRAVGWLALSMCGCGFSAVAGDGGAGGDLAGVDLGGAAGGDLGVQTGPGPLGALPAGYCCTADTDCRGRTCGGGGAGANSVCLDVCLTDGDCQQYGLPLTCNTSSGRCTSQSSFQCIPANQYTRGTLPSGDCCTLADGSECAGGLCIRTGASNNPLYCSQGCNAGDVCPSGYTCAVPANGAQGDFHQCWFTPTILQLAAQYECKPL